MPFESPASANCLQEFDFATLFVEELGWDRHNGRLCRRPSTARRSRCKAVAEKRGMVAFECASARRAAIPDYATRRKIEHQVAKTAHEHLIVFTDAERDRRRSGSGCGASRASPLACREHTFARASPATRCSRSSQAIAFSLDEEEQTSRWPMSPAGRAPRSMSSASPRRSTTSFKNEHAAFLKFIEGIADEGRPRVVCLGDAQPPDVRLLHPEEGLPRRRPRLPPQPARTHASRSKGKDKFYSFYRYFLLRLFHEGLGGKARKRAELDEAARPHPVPQRRPVRRARARSERYADIEIPDEAFERIFDLLRPVPVAPRRAPAARTTTRSTPMCSATSSRSTSTRSRWGPTTPRRTSPSTSARTRSSRSCSTPREAKCKVAFENPDGPTVWRSAARRPRPLHLPGRPARRVDERCRCPPEIAAGVDDVSQARAGWNKPAPAEFALPTETWREVVARRAALRGGPREARRGRGPRDQRPHHAQPRHPPVRRRT